MRGIIAFAVANGVEREELMRAAELEPSDLTDPDGRVDRSQMLAVWQHAAASLGEPSIAHLVSQSIPFGTYDVLDYAFATSPTVAAAFEVVRRYFRLFLDQAELDLEHGEEEVVVRYRLLNDDTGLERFSAEFTFGLVLGRLRHCADLDGWNPRWVTFAHDEPDDAARFEETYQAPVSFGAAANRMSLPMELFLATMRQRDPNLNGVLTRHAESLLAQLPDTTDIEMEVRRHLYSLLTDGDSAPTIEDVGARIGLGSRTLQRRLSDAGTTFATLLDDIRFELATRFLQDDTVTIGEVGFLLGFSEPSAFHRAFRRWSGQTPGAYRRGLSRSA